MYVFYQTSTKIRELYISGFLIYIHVHIHIDIYKNKQYTYAKQNIPREGEQKEMPGSDSATIHFPRLHSLCMCVCCYVCTHIRETEGE